MFMKNTTSMANLW